MPHPIKMIDSTLTGADDEMGFRGSRRSGFNPMSALCIIRGKYPEVSGYRGDKIDRYSAMTLMTFLDNWTEEMSFYGDDWLGKHNNGVVLNMATLMLDQPRKRASTIYYQREGPIITRRADGETQLNDVIYQREGHPFAGGG